MTKLLIAMCLVAAGGSAQEAKVTPLMTKDLVGIPGKEGTMVTVEYPRVGRRQSIAIMLIRLSMCSRERW